MVHATHMATAAAVAANVPTFTVTRLKDGRAAIVFDQSVVTDNEVLVMLVQNTGKRFHAQGYVPARGPSVPPLTRRQAELLGFIIDYVEQHHFAPSFQEMADHFGLRSLASVHEHLENLERKGYIRRQFKESRAIAVIMEALPALPVPMTPTPK